MNVATPTVTSALRRVRVLAPLDKVKGADRE